MKDLTLGSFWLFLFAVFEQQILGGMDGKKQSV
jgi:hypothetical protein